MAKGSLLGIVGRALYQVANMIPTATVMTAVQRQPIAHRAGGSVNWPMTFGAMAMIMMTVISGTATTPLMTAAQKSAFTGSRPMKLMTMPISVATMMVA